MIVGGYAAIWVTEMLDEIAEGISEMDEERNTVEFTEAQVAVIDGARN